MTKKQAVNSTVNKSSPANRARRPLLVWVGRLGLLLFCLAGLAATAFADLYFNKGVSVGSDHPAVPYTAPGDLGGANPLGVNTLLNVDRDPADMDKQLDMVKAGGYGFIRQQFPWAEIEKFQGQYTWEIFDMIVDKASARGINVIARLDKPPSWSRAQVNLTIPADLQATTTGPPDDYAEFGKFVNTFVSRYKGKVKYYQIWNEPNLEYEWNRKRVDATQYTQLLKVAHDQAKAADPNCVILSAALSPTNQDGPQFNNLDDLKYLDGMYKAGAFNYYDVMAAQAYGLGYDPEFRYTEPDFREPNLKRVNFSRLVDMRAVMEKYGDYARPVWVTEYGWLSVKDGWPTETNWGDSVDEQTQAAYLVGGIERARAEWPWLGVMNIWFLKADKPLLDNTTPQGAAKYFALLNPDYSPRRAYFALQHYAVDQYKLAGIGYKPANDPSVTHNQDGTINISFQGDRLDLKIKSNGAKVSISVDTSDKGSKDFKAGTVQQEVVSGLVYGWHTATVKLDNGAEFLGFYVSRGSLGWLFLLLYAGFTVGGLASGWSLGRRSYGWLHYSFWPWYLPKAINGARGIYRNRSTIAPYIMAVGLLLFYFAPNTIAGMGLLLFFVATLARPDWAIAMAVLTAPLYLHPRNLRALDNPLLILKGWLQPEAQGLDLSGGLSFSLVEVVIVLTAIAWAVQALYNFGRAGFKFRLDAAILKRQGPFFVPLAAFFVLATLSLLAPEPAHLKEALREFRTLIIEPLILYLLVVRFIKRGDQVLRLFDMLVITGVLISLGGLYQFLFTKDNTVLAEGVSRVTSIYNHPDNLGLYLGRILPIAFAVGLFGAKAVGTRRSWLYLAAVLPIGAAIGLSFSRGAWLATAVTLFVVLAVAGSRRGLLIYGAAILLVIPLIALSRVERIASLFSLGGGSNNARLLVWQASIDMIRDHPVTGIGLDQFLYRYQVEYVRPDAWLERFTSHPHNFLFDYWLRLGIIGPVVLLWLLVAFFAVVTSKRLARLGRPKIFSRAKTVAPALDQAAQLRRVLSLGLLGSMTTFVAHGLVDNSYFLIDLAMVFCLSFGMLEVLRRESISATTTTNEAVPPMPVPVAAK